MLAARAAKAREHVRRHVVALRKFIRACHATRQQSSTFTCAKAISSACTATSNLNVSRHDTGMHVSSAACYQEACSLRTIRLSQADQSNMTASPVTESNLTRICVSARMGRHMVSLATLMKPIATSSALLAGCPAFSACALTSSATRSNAFLRASGAPSVQVHYRKQEASAEQAYDCRSYVLPCSGTNTLQRCESAQKLHQPSH